MPYEQEEQQQDVQLVLHTFLNHQEGDEAELYASLIVLNPLYLKGLCYHVDLLLVLDDY